MVRAELPPNIFLLPNEVSLMLGILLLHQVQCNTTDPVNSVLRGNHILFAFKHSFDRIHICFHTNVCFYYTHIQIINN